MKGVGNIILVRGNMQIFHLVSLVLLCRSILREILLSNYLLSILFSPREIQFHSRLKCVCY